MTEQAIEQQTEQEELDLGIEEETVEEKLEKLKNNLRELSEYMDFIDSLEVRQKGDAFTLNELFLEVTKVTPSGHLDVNVYKNEGGMKGMWLEKRRMTPKGLEQSKKYAKDTARLVNMQIENLESEIAKGAELDEPTE